MKRTKASILLATALSAVMLFSACSASDAVTIYEISDYRGTNVDASTGLMDFNKELFYRNDMKTGEGADPFVLDNTAVDGYYYMYYTFGACGASRSKDMMNWEPVGSTLDVYHYNDETRRATAQPSSIWAEEVIYDAEWDGGTYFMFFSASPERDLAFRTGEGIESGTAAMTMYVATAKSPAGPFRMVNFRDQAAIDGGYYHEYNTETGIVLSGEEDYGTVGLNESDRAVVYTADTTETVYKYAYPHYYAKYQLFNPEQYNAFSNANGGSDQGGVVNNTHYGGYTGSIDPHPFVDTDGTKYLYWVDNIGENRICVVEMENWLKPKWETAKAITHVWYYTVEDWEAMHDWESGLTDEMPDVETVSYESSTSSINEGPVMTEHNGMYYLTYSHGNYTDNSYSVAQAVSENPDGPFRKLTEAEGGVLLSGIFQGNEEATGTGHHSFVTVDDQMYIVYHRHVDPVTMGVRRYAAVDEVEWITIKDKDGNDLDIMYANGPTTTIQPAIVGEYKNIAEEAQIELASGSLADGSSLKWLNDGLLSTYMYGDPAFYDTYVRETEIANTATFELTFDTARTVRAIMVYNSKNTENIFLNISRVEFVCEEDGKEVTRFIEDLAFPEEFYQKADIGNEILYVTPGAAAFSEFYELNVKSIKVTVEVPAGQSLVGISEIRVLGK